MSFHRSSVEQDAMCFVVSEDNTENLNHTSAFEPRSRHISWFSSLSSLQCEAPSCAQPKQAPPVSRSPPDPPLTCLSPVAPPDRLGPLSLEDSARIASPWEQVWLMWRRLGWTSLFYSLLLVSATAIFLNCSLLLKGKTSWFFALQYLTSKRQGEN